MKKILNIDIECGQFTCAYRSGKFCKFAGSIKSGRIAVCKLFPTEEYPYTRLESKDGWLQRCDDCLKYEQEEK